MNLNLSSMYQLTLLPMVALLAGCSVLKPKEDPTRHYRLTKTENSALTSNSNLRVLIGAVSIPDYLDHTEIVTVAADSEVELAEFHVWAEPLDKGVGRVVASNVSDMLDTGDVAQFPDVDTVRFDYRVPVLIRKFERGADGQIRLEASFSVMPNAVISLSDVRSKKTSVTVAVADPTSFGSTVAAMSEALGTMSKEIAQEVLRVNRKKKADGERAEAEAETAAASVEDESPDFGPRVLEEE